MDRRRGFAHNRAENINIEESSIGHIREQQIVSRYAQNNCLDVSEKNFRIQRGQHELYNRIFHASGALKGGNGEFSQQNCDPFDGKTKFDIQLFDSETFNTVSAVGSVFHASDWRTMLADMAMLTKIGGTILFDIGSKENSDWAVATQQVEPEFDSTQQSGIINNFVSLAEMDNFCQSVGLVIKNLIPYDFLNDNALLYRFKNQAVAETKFLSFWKHEDVVTFWCQVEAEILSLLPHGMSRKTFIIAEKMPAGGAVFHSNTFPFVEHFSEAIKKTRTILHEQKELFLLYYLNAYYESQNRTMWVQQFYSNLSKMIFPAVEVDPITLSRHCDRKKFDALLKTNKCHPSVRKGIARSEEQGVPYSHPFLLKEFSERIEEIVTHWYQGNCSTTGMTIAGLTIGPLMEYTLMKELMVEVPPENYLYLRQEGHD